MPLSFEWDERKAKSNLAKHGVSIAEAATIFGDARSLTIPCARWRASSAGRTRRWPASRAAGRFRALPKPGPAVAPTRPDSRRAQPRRRPSSRPGCAPRVSKPSAAALVPSTGKAAEATGRARACHVRARALCCAPHGPTPANEPRRSQCRRPRRIQSRERLLGARRGPLVPPPGQRQAAHHRQDRGRRHGRHRARQPKTQGRSAEG